MMCKVFLMAVKPSSKYKFLAVTLGAADRRTYINGTVNWYACM